MTEAEITAQRDAALSAYTKARDAKQYSINSGGASRSITRQELETLRKDYEYWESKLAEKQGTSRRVKFVTPRF